MSEQVFKGSFEEDVPAHLQNDILEEIEELAWSGEKTNGRVEIYDLEKRNITNIEYMGTIEIDGVVHDFHIASGNDNGTVILNWNGTTGSTLEREPPPGRALVPRGFSVEDAIHRNQAKHFLDSWDADLNPGTSRGRVLHDIPQKVAYDAFFSPGSGSLRHFEKIANDHGYTISDEDEARAMRRKLHLHDLRLRPKRGWNDAEPDLVNKTYVAWSELLDPKTEPGLEMARVRVAIATRLSRTRGGSPSPDECKQVAASGFELVDRTEEAREWFHGLSSLFTATPIEGFDRRDLPEDPMRGLFADFFRHTGEIMNMDRRVVPEREVPEVMDAAFRDMARNRSTDFPERYAAQLETYGYRLTDKRTPVPEPVSQEADEMDLTP